MVGRFKRPDNEGTLPASIQRGEPRPRNHRARFGVDGISPLDRSERYARYAPEGGEGSAPEIVLGLLFYGYATGRFSSRKLEKARPEAVSASAPFPLRQAASTIG